jgi:hypothetical protein
MGYGPTTITPKIPIFILSGIPMGMGISTENSEEPLNAALLEQRQELLLKGHLPVVLRLALEMVNAPIQPSLRDSCNAEPASLFSACPSGTDRYLTQAFGK